MGETIKINGIMYLVLSADDLYNQLGIEIDAEFGLVYVGPESGTFTEEVIEVPESGEYEGQICPVVGFAGGMMVLQTQNTTAAALVSEVILPSSILFLMYGFFGFTKLQKVTCCAESTPKLSSQIGADAGVDFAETPDTKELYIPSGLDYTTWEEETTWGSVNEIYNGFIEIVDGLKYNETSENTVALIGYDETFTATSLTIPSSITHEGNNYTVTEINRNVFKNYTGLTEVNIPNSVTKISETAFSSTDFQIQTIDVHNISLNLISIDTRIDKFLLKNTSGITFTYGNITETTTEYACECLGLTDTTISTPTLDLTNLTYNNNKILIYTIKASAFANNNSIITAILPEETKLIEGSIFDNCQNFDTVYFNCKSAQSLSSNYGPIPFFGYYNYVKTIIIGNSVTSIEEYAFASCSSLTSVTIPNSVTSIGNNAFYNCSSLTSVTIPNSVTSIEEYAFASCSSLTSVTIPNSVTSIKYGTFSDCSSLTSVNIPNSVTSIGTAAFWACGLTSVTIPDSVTKIDDSAFYNCQSLTSITIPNSVTSIGDSAFSRCSSLTSIDIPNSVTTIRSSAFSRCSSLTSVTIPNSVTSIETQTFSNCSSLTSVTIPNSVTSIKLSAFSYCSSLTSVCLLNPTAPAISYNYNPFQNTPSTKLLIVPIGATGYSTSWAYTSWAAVNYTMVPTEEINYKLNDINTIETYSSNNTSETLTIPSTVTYNDNTYSVNKVSRNSLANDNVVKTLTIESGINTIEASALSGCNNLETISIPNSVTEIDNHAFWMCRNLTTVNLPSTLTKLKPEMFVDCVNLETITIPNGITIIPFRMFEGCKKLTTVNLPSTINKIQWSAFKDCECLTTINIPSGCNVDPTAFEGTNIKV